MKLMVIGSGGREHAVIRSLLKNPRVTGLHALPGRLRRKMGYVLHWRLLRL